MRFEVFFGAGEGWRWRAVAGNGEITAQSEGYSSKSNTKRAVRRFVLTIVGQLTEADYSELWTGKTGERIEIVDVDA